MPNVSVGYANNTFAISPDPVTVPSGTQTLTFDASGTNVQIVSFELDQAYSPNPFSWTNPALPSSSLSVTDNNTGQATYNYTLTVKVGTSTLKTRGHQITNESER